MSFNAEQNGWVTVRAERYYRDDAFLYFDETEALHPLPIKPEANEPPDTYPWGT